MGILFKRKYIFAASNAALVLVVAAVMAVCFYPLKASRTFAPAPYYQGREDGGRISLMFNVYEGEDVVNGILDLLKQRGEKATFFMGGCFAEKHEELVRRIAEEGHEIGNHGYFHLDHASMSVERNKEEIEATGKLIESITGVKPVLFAPPSGAFGENTLSAAEQLGYAVVMWSKDTIDWRDSDEDKLFRRATTNAKSGDLVLMHPKPHTLAVLGRILDNYKSAGLKVGTVSENIFGE